jgi:hypothetical protein
MWVIESRRGRLRRIQQRRQSKAEEHVSDPGSDHALLLVFAIAVCPGTIYGKLRATDVAGTQRALNLNHPVRLLARQHSRCYPQGGWFHSCLSSNLLLTLKLIGTRTG